MSEVVLRLPRPHAAQLPIIRAARRFNVVCCGRRWGKTVMGNSVLLGPALAGGPVAWFSPTHKMLAEVWRETKRLVQPIIASANASEHRIDLVTGGTIEMWSLENYDSIRGRKYRRVVADEVAMVASMGDAWQAVIRPTLTDYRGDAWFLSTPRGMNFFHAAWLRGQDSNQPDWASWQMPTASNPYIDALEIESARLELPERVFQQEYLAQFLEDAGGVFRKVRESVNVGRCENEASNATHTYYVGADLARLQDFTVISVVDSTGRQVYHERFNQISWERQIDSICRVSVAFNNAPVVLDCTGIGDPIYEQLRGRNMTVLPFKFSNSSKEQLMNNLALRLEQGECALMDLPIQTGELQAFQYDLTRGGTLRMAAPEGQHDDCVCSLALAYWGIKLCPTWEFW